MHDELERNEFALQGGDDDTDETTELEEGEVDETEDEETDNEPEIPDEEKDS